MPSRVQQLSRNPSFQTNSAMAYTNPLHHGSEQGDSKTPYPVTTNLEKQPNQNQLPRSYFSGRLWGMFNNELAKIGKMTLVMASVMLSIASLLVSCELFFIIPSAILKIGDSVMAYIQSIGGE